MAVTLGVLAGSIAGARILPGANPRMLRIVFAAVVGVLVEIRMGAVLPAGVVIAATVVLVGGVWYFAMHAAAPLRLYRGEPAALRGPEGVLRGVLAGDVRSAIQLGLLLLIATPVARVVVVSAIVLALLLYGLTGLLSLRLHGLLSARSAAPQGKTLLVAELERLLLGRQAHLNSHHSVGHLVAFGQHLLASGVAPLFHVDVGHALSHADVDL
jgi:uncharacterized membrane protein